MGQAETKEVQIPDCYRPYDGTPPQILRKRVQVRKQIEQTRANGTVTCNCGKHAHVREFYKCLYCGEWYCRKCAEAHFGKTVAEFRKEFPETSILD